MNRKSLFSPHSVFSSCWCRVQKIWVLEAEPMSIICDITSDWKANPGPIFSQLYETSGVQWIIMYKSCHFQEVILLFACRDAVGHTLDFFLYILKLMGIFKLSAVRLIVALFPVTLLICRHSWQQKTGWFLIKSFWLRGRWWEARRKETRRDKYPVIPDPRVNTSLA